MMVIPDVPITIAIVGLVIIAILSPLPYLFKWGE
jgi:hypothetical protein